MSREKLQAFLRDLGTAALAGAAIALGLSVLLLAGGFLLGGFQVRRALVTVRGGLLITGALGLFICAGLLLMPRGGAKIRESAQWKRRFQVLGLTPVVAVAAVLVLAVASVVDYYLYF